MLPYMAGIDLTTAQTQLDAYLAAETAVLGNQSYTIAGRSMTRADLGEIRRGITYWNNQVRLLTQSAGGRGRSRNVSVIS